MRVGALAAFSLACVFGISCSDSDSGGSGPTPPPPSQSATFSTSQLVSEVEMGDTDVDIFRIELDEGSYDDSTQLEVVSKSPDDTGFLLSSDGQAPSSSEASCVLTSAATSCVITGSTQVGMDTGLQEIEVSAQETSETKTVDITVTEWPQPIITIINAVKDDLPADYGSDGGVFDLVNKDPFGREVDMSAATWTMELTQSYSPFDKPTDQTIYFAYIDNEDASAYAEPSPSCQNLDFSNAISIRMSIDNQNPELPATNCAIE